MNKTALLGIALLLMGCKQNTSDKNVDYELASPAPMDVMACIDMSEPPPVNETVKFAPPYIDEDETSVSAGIKKSKQKIIRNADITILEDELELTKNAINKLVKLCKGYYSSDNYTKREERSSIGLSIKVPAENFDKFIHSMEGLKLNITRKLISSEDVTEEYYDIQTRLANQRKLEQRYLELLTKAQKVSDMLEIEEHIETIREEVESAEGKIKYMDDRVAYSTIDIVITTKEKEAVVAIPGYMERARLSLGNGWESLVDTTINTFRYWPLYILLCVLILIIKRVWKKRKAKIALS